MVKYPPAMQETWVPSLSQEGHGNPLHYSCLENSMHRGSWKATFLGSQGVRHNWVTNTFTFQANLGNQSIPTENPLFPTQGDWGMDKLNTCLKFPQVQSSRAYVKETTSKPIVLNPWVPLPSMFEFSYHLRYHQHLHQTCSALTRESSTTVFSSGSPLTPCPCNSFLGLIINSCLGHC